MWGVADRIVKGVSDLTVGTVIVMVHVMLADRQSGRTERRRSLLASADPAAASSGLLASARRAPPIAARR
jgi:hypothetical protein